MLLSVRRQSVRRPGPAVGRLASQPPRVISQLERGAGAARVGRRAADAGAVSILLRCGTAGKVHRAAACRSSTEAAGAGRCAQVAGCLRPSRRRRSGVRRRAVRARSFPAVDRCCRRLRGRGRGRDCG
eukprot:Amastigsp_a846151_15.p3 type:complete len:128 gc:universal Amastigsp_a846151_15:533-150(-)